MPVYLDNAATTRVCPEAARAALEAMTEGYGNPSSGYALGQAAAAALKEHRAAVAGRLGCAPEELIFTSCGTEGDNWAVRAAAEYGRRKGRHIITTAIEHAAVLEPVKVLAAQGYEVTYLKPDRSGHVSPDALRAALRPDTVLVSMMLVNNELGTLLPVAEAAQSIRDAGSPALLHCDAVQAFLKVPFTPAELGVDLLTLSGHKIRAPKGIGVQYIRRGLNLKPLLTGGGQEGGGPAPSPPPRPRPWRPPARRGKRTIPLVFKESKNTRWNRSLPSPGWRSSAGGTPPTSAPSPCPATPAKCWCGSCPTGGCTSPPARPATAGSPATCLRPWACPSVP